MNWKTAYSSLVYNSAFAPFKVERDSITRVFLALMDIYKAFPTLAVDVRRTIALIKYQSTPPTVAKSRLQQIVDESQTTEHDYDMMIATFALYEIIALVRDPAPTVATLFELNQLGRLIRSKLDQLVHAATIVAEVEQILMIMEGGAIPYDTYEDEVDTEMPIDDTRAA